MKPILASIVVPASLQRGLTLLRTIPTLFWQRLISFGLTLAIISVLVNGFWWLLTDTKMTTEAPVAINQSSTSNSKLQINMTKLQALSLFGKPELILPEEMAIDTVNAERIEATPTKLQLILKGIVSSSKPSEALAIIVYQNREEVYSVGDKLPLGRVVLSQIYADHVIIENAGRYESLWLFSDDLEASGKPARSLAEPSRSSSRSTRGVRQDFRDDDEVQSMALSYKEQLYKNPSALAEVIRVSPKQQNGQMIGYRINPGRDKEQFERLGLKPNDVVTSINDIALDDPAKAIELYKIMRSASEASFVIDRDGEQIELLVSLGQDD